MRKQLLIALLTTWPCIAGNCEDKNKEQNKLIHLMFPNSLPALHGALCAEKELLMLEMQGKSNYNSSLSLWQQHANESRMIETAKALSEVEEALRSPLLCEKNRSFKYMLIQALSQIVVESIARFVAGIGPNAPQKKSKIWRINNNI